ncbi:MAG: cupin domain-containing protein [Candidatus Omnitrophota bacterium]
MPQKAELKVLVEKPTNQKLNALKVFSWPVWTKEVSSFDWYYDEKEICYFLEGEVTVKTSDGEISFGKGDLVTFPQGLKCVWDIKTAVKKHYKFG